MQRLRLVLLAYLSMSSFAKATTAVTITVPLSNERCLDALSSSPRFPFLPADDYWKLARNLPNDEAPACYEASMQQKETEVNLFITKQGSFDAEKFYNLMVTKLNLTRVDPTVIDPTVVHPTVVNSTVAHPTVVNQTWTTKEVTRYLCFAGDIIGRFLGEPIIVQTSKACYAAHGTWYAVQDVYAGFGPDGIDCSKGLLCGFEAGKVNVVDLLRDSSEAATNAFSLYLDSNEAPLLQKQKALTQEKSDLLREKADIDNVWPDKQEQLQQWSVDNLGERYNNWEAASKKQQERLQQWWAKFDDFSERYNNWEAASNKQRLFRLVEILSRTTADSTSASAQYSDPRYMNAFMKRLNELMHEYKTSPPTAPSPIQ